MTNNDDINISEEIINKVGLHLSDKPVNANLAPDAMVFTYPDLENVYVMESDLYGNTMPRGSCFIAFHGRNGLIGKHLKVEELANASVADIKKMVQSHAEG